jgi:hypothetical protein
LDHVYDLVEGNIGSEVRAKIEAIEKQVDHPLAQPVAKVICLLQFVKSVHRTAENIAAALYPRLAADSQLVTVREALRLLEETHNVRYGEDGYRIPKPSEDDWERSRHGISPKPGDARRLYAEVLSAFWQPQPMYTMYEAKTFKAGLALQGRDVMVGDMTFHIHLAEDGRAFQDLATEIRTRSQQERRNVYWAVSLNECIDRETVEVFRSKEILARKEREAKTADETALIVEEKIRLRRHQDELKRLLKVECLAGSVYFRGNDRSFGDRATDVTKSASEILGLVLPEVFDRFSEAAARPGDVKKGADALFTAENLQGLPAVFDNLTLLRNEKGRTIFQIEGGPLAEVLSRIEERANYGDTANGRFLVDEFAKEPFGWDFEALRLFVLCLLRAEKIEVTSKGQVINSVASLEAKETFNNNNLFRQSSFRPKKGIEFEELVKASEAFRDTFGSEVRELSASSITAELRREIAHHEDEVAYSLAQLTASRLPGGYVLEDALGQMKAILRGSDDHAIAAFNASHRSIKDAIKRGAELEQALTEPRLRDIDRAAQALSNAWPFLKKEPDIADDIRLKAETLADLLARETFFRELPAIEQYTRAIEREYDLRYGEALHACVNEYTQALNRLSQTPGWIEIDQDQQQRIAAPLVREMSTSEESLPIPQLRSEREACESRLKIAIAEVQRIVEGERLVTLSLGSYFSGGIETEEQLEAALTGIREECARLIGSGKKVIVQ